MNHLLAKRVDDLGIVACVLYIVSRVLLSHRTVLVWHDALRLAQPMLVVSGLTISLCIVELAYKSLHMRSKMVCWTAALIAVLVISAVRTGDVRLLESVLLIIAVTDIDKQRLFKLIATALAASIAVVVLASLCGWIWNKDVIPNGYLVFAWGLHIRIRLGVC